MESRRPSRASHRDAVLDQRTTISVTPHVWVDEQRIEFGIAVVTRQHGREPSDTSFVLHYEDVTGLYLLERKRNRIGIGEESVAVTRIRQ